MSAEEEWQATQNACVFIGEMAQIRKVGTLPQLTVRVAFVLVSVSVPVSVFVFVFVFGVWARCLNERSATPRDSISCRALYEVQNHVT
jgi:hypothetical protein